MAKYMNDMVLNALRTRPSPKGVMIPVPRYEKYLFCPEVDHLYSTKMAQCEFYPLQRIEPTQWNDHFDGWNITNNGDRAKLSIDYLRKLKPKEETMSMIPNTPSTNAADFKGKFLVGSINKTTGQVSFSAHPARQPNREVAKAEAARLAAVEKGKMFAVVQVLDIASVQDVVFL